MRLRRKVRQVFETGFGLLCASVVPLLSRRAVRRLARAGGGLAFRLARRERRIALANLDVVFGAGLSGPEKAAIARGSFRTFALLLLDTFWFARDAAARLARYVRWDGSTAAYFSTKPCIVITAHLGNWEILGKALAARGAPTTSVAAPLRNAWMGRLLARFRSETGQQIVPRQGAMRALMKTLKAGERVGLLLDQNTKPAAGGVFVDFFGRKVPVSGAPAALALKLGVPLVFLFCLAAENGSYRIFAGPPLAADGGPRGTEAFTQEITRRIEEQVRRYPDQWMWMYKRWKYAEPGADLGRYPFYAKILPG
ncbi:MAG: lysophospholipid acyltransferase family protein [Kiritimatiellae bacterium]|nr:lysophospholipid acyltransferase family protein [Kiritimatiellia bacterium]